VKFCPLDPDNIAVRRQLRAGPNEVIANEASRFRQFLSGATAWAAAARAQKSLSVIGVLGSALRAVSGLDAFLPPAVRVETLGIDGPTRAVHSALDAALFLPRLEDGWAEGLERRIRRSRRRNGAGSNIQADDATANSPTQRRGAWTNGSYHRDLGFAGE
jgi:hypothetical protein